MADYTQDANCQAAWLMDEGSGESLADSSANSNTGTFASEGNPAWAAMSGTNAPSYTDDMLDFFADYIFCGTDSSLDIGGALSISMWVYLDTYTSGTWARIVACPTEFTDEYVIAYSGDDDRLKISRNNSDAEYISPNENEWIHIVMGFTDSDDTNQFIYLNGILQGKVNDSDYAGRVSGEFALGAAANGVSNFDGKMSETAIFDRELTISEVNDIMDNGLKGAGVAVAMRRPYYKGRW